MEGRGGLWRAVETCKGLWRALKGYAELWRAVESCGVLWGQGICILQPFFRDTTPMALITQYD